MAADGGATDADGVVWTEQKPVPLSKLPLYYAQLAKVRLGGLVVMTTAAGFAAAPCPLSMATMGYVCTGTALCVASANILNQVRAG